MIVILLYARAQLALKEVAGIRLLVEIFEWKGRF